MTGFSSSSRPRRSPQVAMRRIADEVLLVPIRSDPAQASGLYSLNRTAGYVWDLLDGERSVEDLGELLVRRFQVDAPRARADLVELLDDLLEAGVVEIP